MSKEGRELGLVLFVSTANRLRSGLVISMSLGAEASKWAQGFGNLHNSTAKDSAFKAHVGALWVLCAVATPAEEFAALKMTIYQCYQV